MESSPKVQCVHETPAGPVVLVKCRRRQCRKEFVKNRPWQRFCSRDCQQRFHGRLK